MLKKVIKTMLPGIKKMSFEVDKDEDPYEVRPPVCQFQEYQAQLGKTRNTRLIEIKCVLTGYGDWAKSAWLKDCDLELCPLFQTWQLLKSK